LTKSRKAAVVMHPCGTDHAIMEDKTGALKGNCDSASGGGPVIFQQNQLDEVRLMDKAGALSADAGVKQQNYLAFTQNQSGDILTGGVTPSMGTNQNATGRNTPKVQIDMAVRRLTPRECERLQGFPDDYTKVPVYLVRHRKACPKMPKLVEPTDVDPGRRAIALEEFKRFLKDMSVEVIAPTDEKTAPCGCKVRKVPASECPDGPRYKAIGNSWAVPCAEWIFKRIDYFSKEL
jgi:site-specific DNA-cytosine methylase